MENINRISVIGGSGTGKTTLTSNLGNKLNLPIYHIDGIHHLKNWEIRDKSERDAIILDLIEKEKWIIDGTYRATLEKRLKKSDLVIFLDFSTFAQIRGVLKRYFTNPGKEKYEIPGCNEKLSLKFLLFVWNWRKEKRSFILENLNKIDSKKVIIFKNRRQLNKWFEKEFNSKIIRYN